MKTQFSEYLYIVLKITFNMKSISPNLLGFSFKKTFLFFFFFKKTFLKIDFVTKFLGTYSFSRREC